MGSWVHGMEQSEIAQTVSREERGERREERGEKREERRVQVRTLALGGNEFIMTSLLKDKRLVLLKQGV